MHTVITVTIAVLILHVASSRELQDAEREESSGETERIIMGKAAAPGQFSWAVALYNNGSFLCTASILSPRTVLTAAHCVQRDGQNQPASTFHAIANVKKSAPEVRIEFERVVVNPNYNNNGFDNDLAVFTTTKPIPMSQDVGPICLAEPDIGDLDGEEAIAMGWGATSRSRFFPMIPDNLQYVDQKVIPKGYCQFFNGPVTEDKICASGGGLLSFNGICNGDSGGPLVYINEDNEPVHIGVASYGNGIIGCGTPNPAVWARTSSHSEWIKTAAEDEAICSLSKGGNSENQQN